MDQQSFEKFVNRQIRLHELRVAIISGIIGLLMIAGIFHAIRLNHLLASACLVQ